MNIQNVNHTIHFVVHAYKQAPWRVQRQWLGTFLLVVLGLLMTASLYLDVTAQAAIEGRQIQDTISMTITTNRTSADLETQLASLTAENSMEQRAQSLGYIPVDPGQVEYVIVPGYSVPPPAILAGVPVLKPSAPSIPPEYTQSLLDWLAQRLRTPPSASIAGGRP